MLNLEIVLIIIQAFFTTVTLAGAAVGVIVLLRTSTIKGLALEVDALADQVQRYRNRDVRRATLRKKKDEPQRAEDEPDEFVDEVSKRKAEIERTMIRGG